MRVIRSVHLCTNGHVYVQASDDGVDKPARFDDWFLVATLPSENRFAEVANWSEDTWRANRQLPACAASAENGLLTRIADLQADWAELSRLSFKVSQDEDGVRTMLLLHKGIQCGIIVYPDANLDSWFVLNTRSGAYQSGRIDDVGGGVSGVFQRFLDNLPANVRAEKPQKDKEEK
jgi:hypothetical protein